MYISNIGIKYYYCYQSPLSREQTEITIEHSHGSSDSSHRAKDKAETKHHDVAIPLLVMVLVWHHK